MVATYLYTCSDEEVYKIFILSTTTRCVDDIANRDNDVSKFSSAVSGHCQPAGQWVIHSCNISDMTKPVYSIIQYYTRYIQ